MVDTNQTWTPNNDGSFTYSDGKTSVKYVKESDLLAVKGGAESKQAELQSQLTSLTTERDSHKAKYLEAQAAFEQSEKRFKEYEPFKTQVGDLTTKLTATEESGKKLQQRLYDRVKSTLVTVHGVKEELLKDKSLDDLEKLEEHARILGASGQRKANFDGGGGGGNGGNTPLTGLDRTKAILANHANRVAATKSGAAK